MQTDSIIKQFLQGQDLGIIRNKLDSTFLNSLYLMRDLGIINQEAILYLYRELRGFQDHKSKEVKKNDQSMPSM